MGFGSFATTMGYFFQAPAVSRSIRLSPFGILLFLHSVGGVIWSGLRLPFLPAGWDGTVVPGIRRS